MDKESAPFARQRYTCPRIGHELQDITLCCTDPNCKLQNRVMCVYCLYYDHYSHKDKVVLIKEIEEAEDPYIIGHWPNKDNIKKIAQLFNKEERQAYNLKVIDPLFDDLKNQIEREIENVRKWVHENSMKLGIKGSKLKNKIKEGYSLETLQEIFSDFAAKYNRHSVSQKHTHLDEINDYVDQFVTHDRNVYSTELKNLYKKEIIKAGKLQYDEQKLTEVIYNFKLLLQQVKPSYFVGPMDLQFYPSNSKNSTKYVKVVDGSKITFEGSRGQGTIVYSDPFPRSRNFCLKFEILDSDVGHESFYFGVAADVHKDEIFWFDSGNQIDLFKLKEHSRKKFRRLFNSKLPGEIVQKGTVFTADIFPEQNILKIYDEEEKSVVESAYVFENYDNWRVFFGIYSKHDVTIQIVDQWAYLS